MHAKTLISTFVVLILFGLVSVQSFAVVRYEPQPLRTSFIRFVLLKRTVFSEIIPFMILVACCREIGNQVEAKSAMKM